MPTDLRAKITTANEDHSRESRQVKRAPAQFIVPMADFHSQEGPASAETPTIAMAPGIILSRQADRANQYTHIKGGLEKQFALISWQRTDMRLFCRNAVEAF
jgi:hypothetical protein